MSKRILSVLLLNEDGTYIRKQLDYDENKDKLSPLPKELSGAHPELDEFKTKLFKLIQSNLNNNDKLTNPYQYRFEYFGVVYP